MSDGSGGHADVPKDEAHADAKPIKRPKIKRSWAMRILRGIGWLVATLIVLIVALLVFITSETGEEFLRPRVAKALEKRFEGTVEIDKLEIEFLGKIEIGGLKIRTRDGDAPIQVGIIRLRPAWGDLGGPVIPLDEVALADVSVHVIKYEDGTSNLTGIYKSKPIPKQIEIRALSIQNVNVTIDNADGSRTFIEDVALAGSVHLHPPGADETIAISKKNIAVNLDPVQLSLRIEKASGLKVGVDTLKTGAKVELIDGKGALTILPVSADIALDLPTLGKRAFPFSWDGVTLELEEGNVDVSLGKLALDAVSLTSANVHAALEQGALKGAPEGELLGLHVDAAKLNQFLGRDVLRSDVDVLTRVQDAGGAPRVDIAVTSGKARVDIGARVDSKNPEAPLHDLSVKLANVDTTELLADPEKKVPPIQIHALTLTAVGTGQSAETVDTRATLSAMGVFVRGIPVEAVAADVRVSGNTIQIDSVNVAALGQRLAVKGTFDRATKEVDARLKLDGDVGTLLAGLSEHGVAISTKLPEGMVQLPKNDLEIGVRGIVGGDLHVRAEAVNLRALGAKVVLFADVELRKGDVDAGEKSIVLRGGDVSLDILGLRLSSILGLRGKAIPAEFGLDAVVNVHAKARGTRASPDIDLSADLTTVRKDKGRTARADLRAVVNKHDARLDVSLHDAKTNESILSVLAAVPILLGETDRKLDDTRPFDVRVAVARRSLTDLVSFVPPGALKDRKIPDAEVELRLAASGSFANPSGTVFVDARGPFIDPARRDVMSSVRIEGALEPGKRTSADFNGTVALAVDDKTSKDVRGTFSAHLPYSIAQGGLDALTYDTVLDIGPLALGKLPDLEKLAGARAIGGTITGKIHVAGTRSDLTAEVDLAGTDLVERFASKEKPAPFDLTLKAALTPDTTTVALATTFDGTPLVTLNGTVGIAGKGLLPRLKGGLDPALDATLVVEERSLASLAIVSPKLAELPGTLGGRIAIKGTAKAPTAVADLAVDEIPMWSQKDGAARIKLDADMEKIEFGVFWGAGAEGPFKIRANVGRDALKQFLSTGAPMDVLARIEGQAVDIKDIVPKLASDKLPVDPEGKLQTDLAVKVALEKVDGKTVVKSSSIDGGLDLFGNIPIPGSKRVLRDLALKLTAAGDTLTLAGLSAKESDKEFAGRSIVLEGAITIPNLKPETATLHLKADRWLLFGTKMMGMVDAPRGTLTADLQVRADLAGDIRKVTVDVDKLEALFPDRFDKAHQPEDVHAGDLIDLKTGKLGKLPVPDSVKPPAKVAEKPSDPAPPSKDTEIAIVLKPGARVLQSPIDFTTQGRLDIAIRSGVRTIRGKLEMTKGELSLGGAMHPLTAGSYTFDDKHPGGWLELAFEKQMEPWALRGSSEASAGRSLKIKMEGTISDRKTVLSGAGTPGALFDLLAMHNEGRERFLTGPDMPESVTVDFPQHQGLLVLSFISVNLPHLLFLDRVSGWADPFDAMRSYGRIENYEGERYFANGDGRFKATMRPEGVGRSDAEIEFDYLFTNDPRLMVGVGGAAGSRGGGGPGFVLEWSSSD